MRPDTLVATGGGTLVLPGRVVHESHGGYGTITMSEVLEKSSNIGAILIGTRVGRENMYEYARRLGFGQRTGLPLRRNRRANCVAKAHGGPLPSPQFRWARRSA